MAHEHHKMSFINLIYNNFVMKINYIKNFLNKNFIKLFTIFFARRIYLHLHAWSQSWRHHKTAHIVVEKEVRLTI